MKVVLFDPSLANNSGAVSNNLGDLIIYGYVHKILEEMFPRSELVRIATHSLPSRELKRSIDKDDLCFIGGTNILNSTVDIYNNWHFDTGFWDTVFSPKINAITLGVGWGEYQNAPNFYSRTFYSRRLSDHHIHSVRDSYSRSQLQKAGAFRALNTSCPTTWELNGKCIHLSTHKVFKKCVLTLTDYSKDQQKDEALMAEIMKHFSEIIFFPQGKEDRSYMESLSLYRNNKEKFKVLGNDLADLRSALSDGDCVYIGTRLHAGILALDLNVPSLIVAIDSRAIEMAKDTHLPIIMRDQVSKIDDWLKGNKVFGSDTISIPVQNIVEWKKQFVW